MKIRQDSKQRVAILFGGQSTEHEVSLCSSINIIRALDRQKYDLMLIGIDKHGRWSLYDEQDYLLNIDTFSAISLVPTSCYLAAVPGQSEIQFVNVSNNQPLPLIDVVFSVLHGSSGENGSLQGLLKLLNIPYVGSDILSSAICMDKDMTKRILRNIGIPVTPSITLLFVDYVNYTEDDLKSIVNELSLPLFVKPARQGSSVGVSKITELDALKIALKLAFRYDTKVLVEQAVTGHEIEIALLGNNSPQVSVCGEIIINEEFYSYDTKYLENTQAQFIIPAKLPLSITNRLQTIAKKVYLALGCSVMARVDFFFTDQGQIFLNEVNTIPGFTSMSMYPKLWEASGLNNSTLLDNLITFALERE